MTDGSTRGGDLWCKLSRAPSKSDVEEYREKCAAAGFLRKASVCCCTNRHSFGLNGYLTSGFWFFVTSSSI